MMRREKLWRHTGWRACLLLTLCSLLAVPAATWGRYDTLASGTDSARVARPVVVLTDTAAGAPLSVNEVGTYAFAVSNTEAGKINETAMAYRITAHVFTDGQPYAGRLIWSLYTGDSPERKSARFLAGTPVKEALTAGTHILAEGQPLPAGENRTVYYWLDYVPDTPGRFDIQVSITAVQADT